MRAKLTVVLIFAAALAAVVLMLRQQRLELSHDIAQAYRRIDRTRHRLWDQQARIAQHMDARQLVSAFERAGLTLEPITPAPGIDQPPPGVTVVRLPGSRP